MFDFSINYHQLVVYDEGTVPVPDNDWTMRHIEQGFSWRPGCVTFETLEDVGALKVEVLLAEDFEVSSEATRAIVVPFGVSAAGRVGLWDIADVATAHVPPGEYALLSEMGYLNRKKGAEAEWCRLTFVDRRGVQPELLRAGEVLSPRYPLLT
jgi:hypothetical protein